MRRWWQPLRANGHPLLPGGGRYQDSDERESGKKAEHHTVRLTKVRVIRPFCLARQGRHPITPVGPHREHEGIAPPPSQGQHLKWADTADQSIAMALPMSPEGPADRSVAPSATQAASALRDRQEPSYT
jgi:hypothetical protein